MTHLHFINAFWRLLKGRDCCGWFESNISGEGEVRPGGKGNVGVLGVVILVGVAPPELETPGVVPPSLSILQTICLISPWPSWLRSLKLHKAHNFPGLKHENQYNSNLPFQ